MTGGMRLSFSCASGASPLQAVLIVIFVPLGLMAPILYLAWWAKGGQERGIRARIERTLELDATEEARKAIAKEDLKLYCTGGVLEREVPGCGLTDDRYRKRFGYRNFPILFGDGLSDTQEQLNHEAREYMKAYNEVIVDHVEKTCPRWQAELNAEERRHVARD